MPKFKIVASKSNKKYNLILSAQSESEAKERVHNEWYSILSVKISEDKEIQGTKFIFWIISWEEEKKWIIVGEDIFKSYVKLRKDLWYNIKYLYPESDEGKLTDENKRRIIHDLEKGYTLKIQSKKQEIKKDDTDIKEIRKIDESFYLKNELEQTQRLIEKVLEKMAFIITNSHNYNLSEDRKYKLETIYNNVIKLKKSTNISKLKEIWELALIKIGQIELESLEEEKDQESKNLLKETNILLKKIGSGKQFHQKNKDINYIFQQLLWKIKKTFSWESIKNIFFPNKKNKELIDKESYSFLKTLLLLEKYKEKLRENNREFFKNFLIIIFPFFQKEKKEKIIIKRKVIKQNITLLEAKKKWTIGSYTTLIKGYRKFFEIIWVLISSLRRVFFFVILFYSFCFIIYLWYIRLWYNFWWYSFNYEWILYLLFILLIIILSSISRGILMFCINIVFFIFLFIFSIVNF